MSTCTRTSFRAGSKVEIIKASFGMVNHVYFRIRGCTVGAYPEGFRRRNLVATLVTKPRLELVSPDPIARKSSKKVIVGHTTLTAEQALHLRRLFVKHAERLKLRNDIIEVHVPLHGKRYSLDGWCLKGNCRNCATYVKEMFGSSISLCKGVKCRIV